MRIVWVISNTPLRHYATVNDFTISFNFLRIRTNCSIAEFKKKPRDWFPGLVKNKNPGWRPGPPGVLTIVFWR